MTTPDLSKLLADVRAAIKECDPMPLMVSCKKAAALCDAVERLQRENEDLRTRITPPPKPERPQTVVVRDGSYPPNC